MPDTSSFATALAGLGFGLSLIIAIGAQNAFVLRQGLRREGVLPIVAICAGADALLILLGVAGVGTLVEQAPVVLSVVRIVGAVFLAAYGFLAARRAFRPSRLSTDTDAAPARTPRLVLTALALTFLNPHVYLDTVVLLGSISATHGAERWWFGGGAALGSLMWFSALGYGARLLAPVFAKAVAWRVLDGLIAVVMFAIAVSLVVGL